jgi:hypothetical protein
MSEVERGEDWVPASIGAGDGEKPAQAVPESWIAEERALRARRLARELSDWMSELRARSAALDSRLRGGKAAR